MRVLVVEDEQRLALAIKHGLEAEGFDVDIVHDGLSGLARATDRSYDVVILDIMLPGLNGYRVCARLRAAGSDAGILMLTAKDGEWDEAEALDTGADDYLSKPFSFVVLVARLKALARRIGSRAPRRAVLGDLVVDSAARTCTRGGTPIALTPREFAVLDHLARRAGEAVSKREILEQVWDAAADSDPNTVEVHISALRRKIDTPFGRSALQTVRGAGYRLEPDGG
ncbi:response regulator transcription factor [Kitasatospora cineracea]|jgi:DNA-binding response OmpR family regulator|uniref:DNA-binding response OmpR family regulator n=1 Tax=Kitasatospora cineracea TaxID=88074 RepID=A0A3N4RTC3_9ACTN|nr:response regulator transcription factor [Kitasatospora cineracea]ROR46249.1 DNA-binding response OmpR family regulator [Kitasatospora cineracea]RPE36622.1 DNA-binding response OmpR family regulator [Kitasatospora cineracea]